MVDSEPNIAEDEAAPFPAARQARALVLLLVFVNFVLLPLFLLNRESPVAIWITYCVPAFLVIGLFWAAQIARAGSSPVSPVIFAIGLLFIVGGAVFDMTATVIHSPDLSDEQNPFARALLDHGHSVSFVYRFALVAQTIFVAFISTLWFGLLKHWDSIIGSLRSSRSFLDLVKAASGGAKLSWRQLLLPMGVSELPCAYHVLWTIAVVLIAMAADRWYLGLEWFGVVTGFRLWIGIAAIALGLGIYFAWLWWVTRKIQNNSTINAKMP